MATFNAAHHETGGVILFSGELILLFCDNVHVTLPNTSQSETGRLYLTTHRMIFTSKSMKGSLKSFSAPFFSMHDLNLEQPIFGANYIKGKVNDEQSNNAVTFKLKFNSGGAIEYGQALQSAARMTRNNAAQGNFQPPPPYTASASQYYQAPPTVYQPAYNCGFVLPTDVFNQPPPAGFVYTSEAPPPYPGLGPQQPAAGYPAAAPQGNSYPAPYPSGGPGFAGSAPGYPGAPPPVSSAYPQPGFQPGVTGYAQAPSQSAYPFAAPGFAPGTAPPAYPGTAGAPGGYPSSNGYPPANPYPPTSGYPGQTSTAGYPPLNNDVYTNASAPLFGGYPDKKSQ